MEQKRRTVTGPMLIEKRKRFEVALQIPEERRLTRTGWLDSFKKASVYFTFFKCAEAHSLFRNNLRERRRHGEAGSVNLEAVKAERQRMRRILARYEPRIAGMPMKPASSLLPHRIERCALHLLLAKSKTNLAFPFWWRAIRRARRRRI
jgi:hypothetical protein